MRIKGRKNAGVEKRKKSLKETSEPGCGEELGQVGFRDTTHIMVLSYVPYPVPTSGGGWGGTLVLGFPTPAPSHQAGQPAGSGQASLAATAPRSRALGHLAPAQQGRNPEGAEVSTGVAGTLALQSTVSMWARTHLDGLSLASRLPSTTAGTQLVSSVQSACSPQLQPVENLEKSQVSRLPGRWQVHFF